MDKETIWLNERKAAYITSSKLPDLVKKGRTKGVNWGDTAKNVLYGAVYQHRTGLMLEQKDLYQFRWGKEQEPNAIDWLRTNCMEEIKSCTNDFDKIIFKTPFPRFGDSPDFYANNGLIVGEIKCPVDQIKIEKYREIDAIHDKTENYEQFLGHFIGSPEATELWWVIYDGYADDAHIVKMQRADHVGQIEKLTARIKDAIYAVDQCLADPSIKISSIETILNERS